MVGTTNTAPLVSAFIRSLETHPKGVELINIVEKILAGESKSVDPALIASLMELSNNNVTLLVDFWILRGTILQEEGKLYESFQTFLEATQWQSNDVNIWLRIGEYFNNKSELIKASYYFSHAQKQFKLDFTINNELNQMKNSLKRRLFLSPGINNENISLLNNISSNKDFMLLNKHKKFHIPPNVESVWNQALECYEEAFKDGSKDDVIYMQAFVHYAHSTIRELLGINGNFHFNLEKKIAKYGLFEYKSFLTRLNKLRNQVVHDRYAPSKEIVKDIHKNASKIIDSVLQQEQLI